MVVGAWSVGVTFPVIVAFVVLLYAPVHMYWQLRGTYSLGRFSAFWRMIALSLFAWWAIAIFAAVLVMMAE